MSGSEAIFTASPLASAAAFFGGFKKYLPHKRADQDMTEGVIWKQLVSFAIPMMIGLLFQQMYNTVDTVIVGQYVGKQALAAVGSTGSIINMLIGLFMGLSTGSSVVISQRYGAHDYEKLKEAVHTAIAVTFILCVIVTVVGILIVTPMLRLMKTPEDVFPEARQYLTVYFAGVTGLLLYNMGAAILRAVGDSRRPLYFLIFSACVNVVGDLVFVLVFDMGVIGVALATGISQMLSAMLVLFVLSHTDAPYGIRWKSLRIKKDMLRQILSLGMPSGIQQAITSFSNVFVQSYINVFGSACMAGWTSYNKIDVFILIPVQSIALASTTFVGQNCGANNYPRAKKGVKSALKISTVITAALALLVIVCRMPLLRLFNDDPEIVEYGSRFILWISPFYITICSNQIYAGALRGIGQAKTPMIIMLCSFVGFRQLYLFVNDLLGGSFVGLSLAYPMGWILCSILLTIFFRRSKLCRREEPSEIPLTAAK